MLGEQLLAAKKWAEEVFGSCELGDARRTRRVVEVAGRLAAHTGESLVQSCEGDKTAQLGAYRLIRNSKVEAEAILEGGYKHSVKAAETRARLLAVEDTTTTGYLHSVKTMLGDLGGKIKSVKRGLWVHSVLLVDADSEQTVGLVEQRMWSRPLSERGVKHQRTKRAYQDKESYKWQLASEKVKQRLEANLERVIAVCDREADVFDYLQYKSERSERFIVRAAQDRSLLSKKQARLMETVSNEAPRGQMKIKIPQRGGRCAREGTLTLRSTEVTLAIPSARSKDARLQPITVNVVLAEEIGEEDGMRWVLLTSEPIEHQEQIEDVLRCYSLRWRIEEYHKAWKSGAGVEQLRMQSRDNLLRMSAILSFVAVRLLQLREVLGNKKMSQEPCEPVLSAEEWKVLWASTEQKKKLPLRPPNLEWAYRALAKLGGFTDTKRTGIASWATLWRGWFRLTERVDGYQLLHNILS